MFAKIFESIYDGTLADNWQAMVTFQQMLILADQSGVVDMTPAAIHRRTGIPTEIIEQGIAILEQPDPRSRSKDMEGRRIARLDPNRDWGWFLVNHAQYRAKITAEEKRAADRARIAAKRAEKKPTEGDKSQGVAECRGVSAEVAKVAHTDTELDTEAEESKAHAPLEIPEQPNSAADPISPASRACKAMIDAGLPPHRVNHSNAKLLDAIAEGVTPQEFADAVKSAIDSKATNPFVWAITVARSEHANRGSPTPVARGSPPSKTGSITQDFDGITY